MTILLNTFKKIVLDLKHFFPRKLSSGNLKSLRNAHYNVNEFLVIQSFDSLNVAASIGKR